MQKQRLNAARISGHAADLREQRNLLKMHRMYWLDIQDSDAVYFACLFSVTSTIQKMVSVISIKIAMAAGEQQMPISNTAIGMAREKK